MLSEDKLQMLLEQNGGVITTMDANKIGVPNERLRSLVAAGMLERVAHGVYMSSDEFEDKMYILQKRRHKVIYSHETALFLHGLTDRDPISYSVTVPTGYNTKTLIADGLKVFSVKRELHLLGVAEAKTVFGNTVTVYDMERTVIDCIRSRNQMDPAIVTDAVKRYVKQKGKNLNRLMDMAKKFRIEKIVRRYMEVLL